MTTQATLEKIKKLKPGDKISVLFPRIKTPEKVEFLGFYNPIKPSETKLNKSQQFSFAEVKTEQGQIKKVFSLSQIVEIL